ncbi:aldehyde dehydrogenase [Kriegella aquimaris]|uniref:Aldehyde dehydrogenase n=1 Tax=Kriegella aquimaris TaxID=192904 RepID=A0A1G9N761_9FLAO|nr:aldehyde dehydrogenase [Kriegella aquimaris]SDL82382.1 aldehyde dehydrogenase (NAD+) [Kriegella aquimaris]
MNIVKKQRDFFQTQKTKEISFRKASLKRLMQEIINREDAICDALYADFKKPKFETLAAETQFVLAELKHAIKNCTSWARPQRISPSLMNWPSADYIYKEPYGTVLIIAPWNYPFQLAIAPLVGAIVSGNTAVIKPSEVTPNTAKIISEIIKSVFEPNYVSVVEGGIEVSQKLLAEKWDYIFFTGSTRVGQIVYESASKHLTPVTLELGGKNPCIVDQTATIATAAKRIVWGKFLNAGQTCIATDYILVHKSVKDVLIEALKKSIINFFGENVEQSSDYARIVDEKHYTGLKSMLLGEDVLFGGDTNDTDNFISPTLVNEPSLDGKLMEGEIFGPILPIISYEDEIDIKRHIMNYGKPLATYVFSNRKSFQRKIIETYSFGGGAVNDTVIQITNKRLPFGGVGNSGVGAYHGKASFDLFSHHKSIIKKANWPDIPLRYPPYTLPIKYVKKIKSLF